MTVHWSNWSQQPDVKIACGGWTTPLWGHDKASPPPLDAGLHYAYSPIPSVLSGGGQEPLVYTFDKTKVTCPACKTEAGQGIKGAGQG